MTLIEPIILYARQNQKRILRHENCTWMVDLCWILNPAGLPYTTMLLPIRKRNGLFFRDICISKLRRTGMKTFTFKVNSVKTFESDTAGDLFSWLRLLQPGTINELKMVKIGKNTYMFSLNRHLYNVCTTSSNVEL